MTGVRAHRDDSGSGTRLVLTATDEHNRVVAIWTHALHIDGPLSEDATRMFERIEKYTAAADRDGFSRKEIEAAWDAKVAELRDEHPYGPQLLTKEEFLSALQDGRERILAASNLMLFTKRGGVL